jgi:hypothetical protein
MQIGNDPVDPTKILTLCERRKSKESRSQWPRPSALSGTGVSAAPLAIPMSLLVVGGWNKNSCTVLHVWRIE